ncbi:MAG: phenylalanine--tRNA ligase subunit beta, partial [Bacteroidia bacterium]|nr:phenylalanine--tRNA ligase subunit beta [Bacteroidia bacterium]
IEEILRIYGYNKIMIPEQMKMSEPFIEKRSLETLYENLSGYLVSNGFHEVLCNSLTSETNDEKKGVVRLLNPLSRDLNVLRNDMLHPILEAAAYNFNRKNEDLKFFERGRTYSLVNSEYVETNHLVLLLSGNQHAEHWREKKKAFDLYYLKSLILQTIKANGYPITSNLKFETYRDSDYSEALKLVNGNFVVAICGKVNTETARSHNIKQDVFFIDIDMDKVKALDVDILWEYNDIPRFQDVRRDLSMVLDAQVTFEDLVDLAFQTDKKLLREVNLFDVYQGSKIEKGKKSYALSFILRDDNGTLKDSQIDKVINKLMSAYEQKFGAQIRK